MPTATRRCVASGAADPGPAATVAGNAEMPAPIVALGSVTLLTSS
jgi:hypothetical protein